MSRIEDLIPELDWSIDESELFRIGTPEIIEVLKRVSEGAEALSDEAIIRLHTAKNAMLVLPHFDTLTEEDHYAIGLFHEIVYRKAGATNDGAIDMMGAITAYCHAQKREKAVQLLDEAQREFPQPELQEATADLRVWAYEMLGIE